MSSRRKKKKKANMIVVLAVICLAIIVAIIGILVSAKSSDGSAASSDAASSSAVSRTVSISVSNTSEEPYTEQPTPTAEPTPYVSCDISAESIISNYAYMIRVSDGQVMVDKNADSMMYPASMTKVMTALIAIENLPDLDEQITITSDMVYPFYEQEASMAGFCEGEIVTVRDLLYGILLPSGADACAAISTRVAGTESAFVDLMNQKAAELGLTGTHFSNCTGLHSEDHYMTCRDMAKLFEAAIQNPTFKEIITAHDYTCPADDYYPEGLYFSSTMFKSLTSDTLSNGAVIMGGKTGTTDEAGYCLTSFAQYNNEIYILVTSGAMMDDTGEHYNIADACSIYGALRQ